MLTDIPPVLETSREPISLRPNLSPDKTVDKSNINRFFIPKVLKQWTQKNDDWWY